MSDADGRRDTPLRLGIVGAGAVARAHVEAARSLPSHFRVSGIADTDVTKARALAAEVGATVFASHEDLAASSLIDAAIVASPHGLHRSHAISFLDVGIPVLVEKPMALSGQECQDMIDAATRAGLPLMVGHIQRFMPLMVAAKRALDSGEVGRPVLMLDTYSGRYEPGSRPDWFFEPRLAGEGILANLGAHSLDRLMFLASSTALSFDSGWLDRHRVPIRASASGTVGEDIRALIVLHGIGFPTTEVTDVACTDGAIRVSYDDGLSVHRSGQIVRREAAGANDDKRAFMAQLIEFHRAVTAGVRPAVPGEYGMAVVKAIEAIAALG